MQPSASALLYHDILVENHEITLSHDRFRPQKKTDFSGCCGPPTGQGLILDKFAVCGEITKQLGTRTRLPRPHSHDQEMRLGTTELVSRHVNRNSDQCCWSDPTGRLNGPGTGTQTALHGLIRKPTNYLEILSPITKTPIQYLILSSKWLPATVTVQSHSHILSPRQNRLAGTLPSIPSCSCCSASLGLASNMAIKHYSSEQNAKPRQ
eukprot:g14271.t1